MANEDIFHLGVKGLIVDPNSRVLLLQSNPKGTGSEYWDIPGGRIQRGSTALETLVREIEEETGLQLEDREISFIGAHLTPIRIRSSSGDVGLIFFVYKCLWGSTPTPQLSAEHTNFRWFSIEDAAEIMSNRIPREFITQ